MNSWFGFAIWIIALGAIGFLIVRARVKQNFAKLGFSIASLVAAASALTFLLAGAVFIQPQERGVVLSALAPKGYREQALEPGLHWINPGAEQVILYSISRQTYTMTSTIDANSFQMASSRISADGDSIQARTRDGQEVFIDISVIYAVNPEQVVDLHLKWQKRYTDELVRPTVRGIVREAAAQIGTQEIVSARRAELEQQIREKLSAKLSENNLLLADFFLRDIRFSETYAAAIEAKQITAQQVLQAQSAIELEKLKAEQARQAAQGQAAAAVIAAEAAAKARLLEAQAEAQGLKLIAEALPGGPETFIQYQYVQKLPAGIKTVIVPANTQFSLPLPAVTDNLPAGQ